MLLLTDASFATPSFLVVVFIESGTSIIARVAKSNMRPNKDQWLKGACLPSLSLESNDMIIIKIMDAMLCSKGVRLFIEDSGETE
jgi:hypothetical protein